MDKTLQLRVITALRDKLSGPLRKIAGEGAVSAKSMLDLRNKLKSLEDTQRQVGRFRDLSSGLADTRSQLQAAQDRVAALAVTLKATAAPSRAMQREFDQAARAAGSLKDRSLEQARQLEALRRGLFSSGISTRDLAAQERSLRQSITGTTAAIAAQSAKLREAAAQQQRLAQRHAALERGQRMAGSAAVAGAGGLGVGYAVSQPLKAIVGAFAPAEDAASQLGVALMGSNGQVAADFQQISDLATRLGDKLPGTTADFMNMMTMLRRQGMTTKTILGGLGEATAYLGVLLKLPVEQAAEFGAKMQDATRTSEKDMMGLMDVIQKSFYSGVDPTNMLQGFTKVAPALTIIRKEGLEAAKALAPLLIMMDQAGMSGEAAGNALRKVFQSTMNQGHLDKAHKVLKDLGAGNIKLDFSDGKGEFGGLEKMFKQLDKLKGLTTIQRTGVLGQLFGDDAETLQVVNTLMAKGMQGYKDTARSNDAQGDLRQRVDVQLRTLTNVWDAATGTFTNALSAIGATVAPELKSLIDDFGDIAAATSKWVKENPRLANGIVKMVAVIGALSAAFGALALTFAAVLGPMVMMRFLFGQMGVPLPGLAGAFRGIASVLRLAGAAVLALGRAMIMTPVGATITAIAIAAGLLYTYWEPIKAFFVDLWSKVGGAFDSAVAAVSGAAQRMWDGAAGIFTSMWASITSIFNGGVTGLGMALMNWNPLQLLYDVISGALALLGVQLPTKFTEFGTMLMLGLINGISSMGSAVKDAVVGMGDNVVGWFKDKLGIRSPSRVFVGLGEFVSQGAAIGIERQQSAAVDAARALAGAIALGGAMAAPGAMAATDGPTGSGPLRIDSRPPLSAAAAGAQVIIQGDTITIPITVGPGTDTDALKRLLGQMLDERERTKAARLRSSLSDGA
jgi:TP901 family phage tail tape measure protein